MSARGPLGRLRRLLQPPPPLIHNPHEPRDAPLGRWNLYVGGAGARTPGYVNLDLLHAPGVDVVADVEQLPFPDNLFQRIECDAVLEHVRHPEQAMREIERVLAPGGRAHIVVPFCHPLHEHPKDYHRFSPDALRLLAGGLRIRAEGWRTGPTATLLVIVLEWVKLLLPWRAWRVLAHGVLGWLLFPLRYFDLILLRTPHAARIGNHYYVWFEKPQR